LYAPGHCIEACPAGVTTSSASPSLAAKCPFSTIGAYEEYRSLGQQFGRVQRLKQKRPSYNREK
jgi:hypothetical protein